MKQPDYVEKALGILTYEQYAGSLREIALDEISPVASTLHQTANAITQVIALLQQHVEQTASAPHATSTQTPNNQLLKDLQDLEGDLLLRGGVERPILIRQAIDEIRRLRAEVERMKAELAKAQETIKGLELDLDGAEQELADIDDDRSC